MNKLCLIYTFNFELGEVLLQKAINTNKKKGIEVVKTQYLLDSLTVEFDNGEKWICYKPYMYRAKVDKWCKCFFDNQAINKTDSSALNCIINNHVVGAKIEYFN